MYVCVAATELQQSCNRAANTELQRRLQWEPAARTQLVALRPHPPSCFWPSRRTAASERPAEYLCMCVCIYMSMLFSCAKAAALLALTKSAKGCSGRLQHGERSSLSDPTNHPFTASLQPPTPPPAQNPHRHATLRRYLP